MPEGSDTFVLMEIKYSSHAVERMIQRKITTQDVELLITDPDGTIRQSRDKIIFYRKIKHRKDNLMAAVTVLNNIDSYEVITVMVHFEIRV
jgi:hypothetical protein